MQKVDIYLQTPKAPKLKKASYQYKLVCRGQELTGGGEEENTTGHRLQLICAIAAMRRMRAPALITIHTESQLMITSHASLQKWKQNGWKKPDGKEPKNIDLWKILEELERGHAIRYQKENICTQKQNMR